MQIYSRNPKLRLATPARAQIEVRDFYVVTSIAISHVSCILDEDRSDPLYNSFVRPYVGKAVDGFYDYLKNNNMKFDGRDGKGPYYAKFCSMAQGNQDY
jgi:hypothetical protein